MGTTKLISPHPWEEVRKICRTAGPRSVAIAYVGVDAPSMLRLARRDVLVVNAGKSALLGHATSPDALERFLQTGVRVYSSPNLHAKVIATKKWAVIGSMNGSANSTRMWEAAVITDNSSVVRAVHELIECFDDLTYVDEDFLIHARAIWAKGKDNHLTGTSAARLTEDAFIRSDAKRMIVLPVDHYTPTPAEDQIFQSAARHVRAIAGPAAKYRIHRLQFPPESEPIDLRVGDVIIASDIDEFGPYVDAPVVVLTEALSVSSTRGKAATLYLTRHKLDLEFRPFEEAEALLKVAGVARPRLDEEHWVRTKRDREAMLSVWGLGSLDR